MENRSYVKRAMNYAAPIALASGLLLSSGCATPDRSTERPMPYENTAGWDPKDSVRSKENRKNYEDEKKLTGGLIGNFIVEGLVRLLLR